MNDRSARVSVRILEKEYQIACLQEERSALLDCAELLNSKMREIRDSGNVIGLDRIAVMAGLNLAHELLKIRAQESTQGELSLKVRQLRERVDSALNKAQRADL
jgi:cell division protein ZapA